MFTPAIVFNMNPITQLISHMAATIVWYQVISLRNIRCCCPETRKINFNSLDK